MGSTTRPTPPTSSLPPLARLSNHSTETIIQAFDNLRCIYSLKKPKIDIPDATRAVPNHLIHDTSVPDSGYASAEEDDEPEDTCENEDVFDLDILRSDTFERDFAIRWLTAFTARSDVWVSLAPSSEEEDARAALVDDAASLLAGFSGEEEEEDLTRTFTFPRADKQGKVEVILNDAALLSTDHTSVGLQSWGSAIVFAEKLCTDPVFFSLASSSKPLRILELGAGTGLLSIVASKLFEESFPPPEVIATDYHPSVLANLEANVRTNNVSVTTLALDWQSPVYAAPLDKPFDVILAADVVYHPDHAAWIKNVVERLLHPCGVFWLIVPVRSTGRHEGMWKTVEDVFPCSNRIEAGLAIREAEMIGKSNGIGRVDEGGYALFEIGWVKLR